MNDAQRLAFANCLLTEEGTDRVAVAILSRPASAVSTSRAQ